MKVQEVMLQAMAKKISWWQAAEILGISDRHMRRWRERYEEFGFRGLFDRRRGKPSPKRVPLATVERVLELYREHYFDLNVQHFHEKLGAEHRIRLSYSWVKGILQGAGMVARGRKRGAHRKRRPRRPLPGMLLHIDGSRHRWLGDERWHDLIVILDDATSEIYYAQLVQEESTQTVMAALREVIEQQGLFCALYSDRGSHFWLTPKAGQKVDHARVTQVGRALRELGVRMIPAYSPQARTQRAQFWHLAGTTAARVAYSTGAPYPFAAHFVKSQGSGKDRDDKGKQNDRPVVAQRNRQAEGQLPTKCMDQIANAYGDGTAGQPYSEGPTFARRDASCKIERGTGSCHCNHH